MPVGQRQDPLPAFRFRVYREGVLLSQVTEVSGLILESREPDPKKPDPNDAGQAPGPGVVLKRGLTQDRGFWDWFIAMQKDRSLRQDLRIVLLDAEGRDAVIWTLVNAYPVKWTGPDLKADTSAVAFESLELRFDRITRD